MIAVTGLMRSGTTPLTMMLHQMGVSMGTTMCFPAHNNHPHLEWEDVEFTSRLGAETQARRVGQLASSDEEVFDFFCHYIEKRRGGLRQTRMWGAKSPFLLPFVSILRWACDEMNEPLILFVATRDFNDTVLSLRRQLDFLPEDGPLHAAMWDTQNYLRKFLDNALHQGVPFPIRDTHEQPDGVAMKIATILQVNHVEENLDTVLTGVNAGGL